MYAGNMGDETAGDPNRIHRIVGGVETTIVSYSRIPQSAVACEIPSMGPSDRISVELQETILKPGMEAVSELLGRVVPPFGSVVDVFVPDIPGRSRRAPNIHVLMPRRGVDPHVARFADTIARSALNEEEHPCIFYAIGPVSKRLEKIYRLPTILAFFESQFV